MSESPLKLRLTAAMKDAMRAKDKDRLGTIRLALAEIKKIEVDERIDPDDARITAVLDKMVKQRRDSISQFQQGGRDELAQKEQEEIEVLQEFLPETLSEQELDELIKMAIAEIQATSIADMGKVMAEIKPKLVGRVDMAEASKKVKDALGEPVTGNAVRDIKLP